VPAARVHVVEPGDTLEKISKRYYGAADRWAKIYEANVTTLSASQGLKPGMKLQIPQN
jgi:nucleoid-associated protein YgaU